MTMPSLVLGSPEWLAPAVALLSVAVVALAWSYGRAGARRSVRVWCAALKALGFLALGLCLLEPLLTGSRPRPGANVFVVLVDNSQSLQIKDGASGRSRADWARDLLKEGSAWRTRLGQDYDVRPYVFDTHLRPADNFEALQFDGTSTALTPSLAALAKRFRGLPVAGVLLVSDGNATGPADVDWSDLPPVYPVLPPAGRAVRDIGVARVTLSQTNFEAAPIVLQTEVSASGFKDQPVVVMVCTEDDKEVERQQATPSDDRETLNFRFQLRAEKPGVSFFRVYAFAAADVKGPGPPRFPSPSGGEGRVRGGDAASSEQTLANNGRLVVVDRGGGPYRVLYVSGRPNWEFKYLRRALDEDAEVHLVGLVRIARREPKFDFRNPRGPSNNPLFKGFDNPDDEMAERRDQPVLVRLGTRDEAELRTGFPQTAEDLYRYHAVVLDDIEAGFFTPDQLALLRNFVSRRGGGFLMLGGPGSFAEGRYDRTPVGDLLPVYLDRPGTAATDGGYRLVLTREGWLQPWVRTRKTEDDERRRLDAMASFQALSRVGNVKPGAAVLSQVRDAAGQVYPALVAQPYGKGRAAALLVGDLWRWGLRRENPQEDDFERSWRQTVRWLVGNVPGRVEVEVRLDASPTPAVEFAARAVGPEYLPLDNANVTFRIKQPDGAEVTLAGEPDSREAGLYVAKFVPRQAGPYRAVAAVTAADGSAVGQREAGWTSQPEADEFARMEPNRVFMETLAARTKGELVAGEKLDSFVAGLSSREAPITESWIFPLWHHALYFLVTIVCLATEWGLRRVNGLP